MNIELALFYFFSAILVFSSVMVISIRNPVKAVLFLVLAFFTSAGVWILLEAEFLAITLVLVYVGAVMVLFLFVVMMLDNNLEPLREGYARYLPIGIIIGIVIVLEISMVVGPERFGLDQIADPLAHGADYSNTKELGRILYTQYVYPFELAAVILVVAIVAAIALTLRRKRHRFIQVEDQVYVKRKDRVRVIKMPSEKKKLK
ncbi:MAG TPA: NADH-quinone oxidoreductase subunit J [Gammaproteobacteria bacterium]|nr:NADH-quinone oxidoreductase subunit J [Gammaproteobacteria bacterium]